MYIGVRMGGGDGAQPESDGSAGVFCSAGTVSGFVNGWRGAGAGVEAGAEFVNG